MQKRVKIDPADNGYVVTCEWEGGLKFERKVKIASDLHEVAKILVEVFQERETWGVEIRERYDDEMRLVPA
jgi:hypothetical protein